MGQEKSYKIHFAPVQGHTDLIYRNLHAKYFGGIDAYYTPFIRVEHARGFRSRDLRDIDRELNQVEVLIPQLLGGDPEELKVMLEMLIEKGYNQADLNLGCPFSMIARKLKGAGILPYPERVRSLMDVVKAYPTVSCSVKMRLGWQHPEECLALLPILNDTPLSAVILHARVGIQEYGGEVDKVAFSKFYEACQHALYYNGDIQNIEDMHKIMADFPALAGVMIGRGLLSNPALALEFRQGCELAKEKRMNLLQQFHDELLASYEERLQGDHQLLMKMKTIWEYFMPGTDRKLLKKIKKTTKLVTYQAVVTEIFND